jgi:N-acetyl-anhydromuramyl-L-alanine amidase AmpD
MSQVIIPGVPFPDPIPFRQARDYYAARRDPSTGKPCGIRNIVIHTAEIGESLEGAEALMRACAVGRPPKSDGSANKASWHYAVDANSITQSVRDDHTAWHAPGLSHCSIGIELSGRARQTRAEWADDFSSRTLELTAQLVARLCAKHGVPHVLCDETGLRYAASGICGHVHVSKAFRKSSHWDPGPAFPWASFLDRVIAYSQHPKTEPAPPFAIELDPHALPLLAYGAGVDKPDGDEHVRFAQERLNTHGQQPQLLKDGRFGQKTTDAVRSFQRSTFLAVSGEIDAYTWRELLREVP